MKVEPAKRLIIRGRAPHLLTGPSGFLAAMVLALAGLAACASDQPKLSGLAIGSTRIVAVDEIIELRMPLQAGGERQWRVSSYDSSYLSVSESPRVEQARDGSPELVTRARARLAGVTEVEITEITTQGRSPRILRFKVRIVE